MTRGNPYTDKQSIANSAFLTIRPVSGYICVIYDIGWTASGSAQHKLEIYRSDASGDDQFMDGGDYNILDQEKGYISVEWNITYDDYLKIKNICGITAKIWYDGVELN